MESLYAFLLILFIDGVMAQPIHIIQEIGVHTYMENLIVGIFALMQENLHIARSRREGATQD